MDGACLFDLSYNNDTHAMEDVRTVGTAGEFPGGGAGNIWVFEVRLLLVDESFPTSLVRLFLRRCGNWSLVWILPPPSCFDSVGTLHCFTHYFNLIARLSFCFECELTRYQSTVNVIRKKILLTDRMASWWRRPNQSQMSFILCQKGINQLEVFFCLLSSIERDPIGLIVCYYYSWFVLWLCKRTKSNAVSISCSLKKNPTLSWLTLKNDQQALKPLMVCGIFLLQLTLLINL
jgi:hypothetical protein